MPAIKKKVAKQPLFSGGAIIIDDMKSHADDPVVVRKAEEAKEFLRKHPIPEHFFNK